ncbi:MAG: ABC transporter permease, partial [Bacteroidota bacterium]
MFRLIVKKEITQALRDVRLQVAASLILVLMLTAVLLGRNAQQQVQNERAEAQAAMYDKWVNQGNKHPHSAAHYGQFAFKPKPVLSFLDVGLDNYTGVSVFLEAHKQNEVLFSSAQDNNVLTRFGEMTAAMVFQLLLPLLIIFLAFNTFSKERTEGTLKMIVAQGVSMRQLFLAKTTGIYFMVLGLFLPVVLLAYLFLNQTAAIEGSQVGLRFIGIVGTYMLYFLIFTLLAVGFSAWSKNAGVALLALLGIWILAGVIAPKAATNLASKLYPAPSQF